MRHGLNPGQMRGDEISNRTGAEVVDYLMEEDPAPPQWAVDEWWSRRGILLEEANVQPEGVPKDLLEGKKWPSSGEPKLELWVYTDKYGEGGPLPGRTGPGASLTPFSQVLTTVRSSRRVKPGMLNLNMDQIAFFPSPEFLREWRRVGFLRESTQVYFSVWANPTNLPGWLFRHWLTSQGK